MLYLIIMLPYGYIKTVHLIQIREPKIIQRTEYNNLFDPTERIDLSQINFKIAFSVEGYQFSDQKADPRIVKYIVYLYTILDGEKSVAVQQ